MELYNILLITHIISGSLALITGIMAAIFRKKKGNHSLAGNTYFYSMTLSALVAVALSAVKFNPFLLGIGLFTLYMILGGKLVLSASQKYLGTIWKWYTFFGVFTTSVMLAPVLLFVIEKNWNAAIILAVFAGLQLSFTVNDLRKNPALDPALRLPRHINKMGGSLIATISAFIVVNVHFLPPLVVWLTPTLIGSILIARTHRQLNARNRALQSLLLIIGLSFFSISAQGQVYTIKKTSQRFAQLTLGMEGQFTPSGGQALEGITTFPGMFTPRFHIGGTHFWGHTEFFVTFPLSTFGKNDLSEFQSFYYQSGVETGARIYPWRIERNKIRPYAGIAMAFYDFEWNGTGGEGIRQSKFFGPVQAGLTYQSGQHLLNIGITYGGPNNENYFTSRTTLERYSVQPMSISIGWKYQLETTASMEDWEEKGITAHIEEQFRKQKVMSGFSLAIGPSASFVLGNGSFNDDKPWLGQHTGMGVFLDLGIGYYHQPFDAHLNLAYRQKGSIISAFGASQAIDRRSVTLEAYKFLFDFHGFVPFIGTSISWDRLSIEERDPYDAYIYNYENSMINPGITFGWDIRPNNVQTWILRTNLRYTPIRQTLPDGRSIIFDQLEFNFIQLVWYPSRWFAMKKG